MVGRNFKVSFREALAGLLALLVLSTATSAFAQTAPPTPPNLPPGAPIPAACGWNTAKNSTELVSSSPAGSAFQVTIGEPSWEQDCFSSGNGSNSFPAYEVFPITIHASPNTTVTFQSGEAIPTPAQIAIGVHNTTLWTWFDPYAVETNSAGVADANFTLAGAVMPFVPNDIANVTLPIVASGPGGAISTLGIPIEFQGGVSTILQSPGPIALGSGIGGQAGTFSTPQFNVVYSPSGPSGPSGPLHVSMQVLGSYENGSVGPMPQGVQISFPQPSFTLQPDSIFYFQVNETNSLQLSNATAPDAYTFAVQERIGNSTYVVPLKVSIALEEIVFGGLGAAGSSPAATATSTASTTLMPGTVVTLITTVSPFAGGGTETVALGALAVIAVLAVMAGAGYYWRSKGSSAPTEPEATA